MVGRANDGQLGNGASGSLVTALQRVDGIVKNVVELSTSVGSVTYSSFVAVTEAGTAYYWPEAALSGSGVGAATDDVAELTGFSAPVAHAAVGHEADTAFVCALLTSGAVECVGHNDFGMLGDGTTTSQATPVSVKGLPSLAETSGARRRRRLLQEEEEEWSDDWYDGGAGLSCDDGCAAVGLVCSEEQLYANDGDVDSEDEALALIATVGGSGPTSMQRQLRYRLGRPCLG